MLAAAWQAVSQCCTRREMRDTLQRQQYLQRTDREQIDELESLLKRLQPDRLSPNGPVEEPCFEGPSTEGPHGWTEGTISIDKAATKMPMASRSQGPAHIAREEIAHEPISDLFVVGVKDFAVQEQPSCVISAEKRNNRQRSSDVLAIPGKATENEGEPSNESTHGEVRSSRRTREPLRPSFHIDGGGGPLDGSTSAAIKDTAETDYGSRFSSPRSTESSSGISSFSSKLDKSRRDSPGNLRAHFAAAGDPETSGWRLQRHFSRFRAAMSGGFARAATNALPAMQSLWHVGELEHQDGGVTNRRDLRESLFSWVPESSLESLRSSSWLFGMGDSQSLHPPPYQTQELPQNRPPDRTTSHLTSAQQPTDNAANGCGDTRGISPVVPPLQVKYHASLPPAGCSDRLAATSTAGDGGPEYFCILGASAGHEGSPSFRRRPIVARPVGLQVKDVARLLGTASLTGDSLGRKSHWCTVLRAAAEAGVAAAQQVSGRPRQQKQLEHVLLLQLLQQQQRMVLLPSALNSTQQVAVCRAGDLWVGTVVQGVGFEAPLAADFVAVELLKVGIGALFALPSRSCFQRVLITRAS